MKKKKHRSNKTKIDQTNGDNTRSQAIKGNNSIVFLLLMGVKNVDYTENPNRLLFFLRRILITIDNLIAPLAYFLLLYVLSAAYFGEPFSTQAIVEFITTQTFYFLTAYLFCLLLFWRTYYNNDGMPFWRNFCDMRLWKGLAFVSIAAIVVFSICYVLPTRSHEFAITSPYVIGLSRILLFIFIVFLRRFFLISDDIQTFTRRRD